MISATAKAAAGVNDCHITATTTTSGMVLSPPSCISSRRVTAANSELVPTILAELSFNNEAPLPDMNNLMGRIKERTVVGVHSSKDDDGYPTKSMLSSWSWNGLLCFSFGDPDLFFDAEEELPLPNDEDMDSDGKIILVKTSVSNSEVSNDSDESIESVEVQFDNGSSVVTTVCKLRGGQENQPRRHQSRSPQHSPQQKTPEFDHPSRMPKGNQNSNQSDAISSHNPFARVYAPPAPKELPLRFLRAGKGDPIEGQRRYEATLQWRKEHGVDNILFEAHPSYEMVKKNYPHYFHLRGKQGEPVFFEIPPKTDLAALKAGGMDLHSLVHHYTMVTEYQWQIIERDDLARSVTVLDLEGIRMMDFVGECVEYVKMCSQFSGQHYPERAGHVIVVNVPRWFAMIWKVVKPMVDEATLEKINIVRGKDAVFAALNEKIPVENIPPEYGGKSVPLGESPEEYALRDLIRHNNALAIGDFSCGGRAANPPCRFCSLGPTRQY